MRRRRPPEEHVNHERWLVSYADFITLLFAFFVVMYSISQINESKYRVLSNTLTAAFNRPEMSLDPFQIGEEARSNPINVIELDGSGGRSRDGGEGQRHGAQPEAFIDISEHIERALGDLIRQQLVRIEGNETWLKIELSSSLLFASGDAELSIPAMEILGEIAAALYPHDNAVRVEGFTDNLPINTRQFPSNWELSSARASAVVRLFVEEGIVPQRLSAVGYGEHRPVADNASAEGRARNRRVILKVSRYASEEQEQQGAEAVGAAAEMPPPPVPDQSGPVVEASGETGTDASAIDGTAGGVRTIQLDDGALLFTRDAAD